MEEEEKKMDVLYVWKGEGWYASRSVGSHELERVECYWIAPLDASIREVQDAQKAAGLGCAHPVTEEKSKELVLV